MDNLLQKKSLLLFLAALVFILCSAPLQAQVYRWVDDDGKVHYGDRPPIGKEVEDLSDTVKNVNVDTSTAERNKVGRIFSKETPEEKNREKIKQVEEADKQRQLCAQAQNQLAIVRDRAFYYVDAEGNERDLTKGERNLEVDRLTNLVNQNCL